MLVSLDIIGLCIFLLLLPSLPLLVVLPLLFIIIGVIPELQHDGDLFKMNSEIMSRQRGIVDEGQMLTSSLLAEIMLLPVVLVQVVKISEYFKFNLASPPVLHLLSLLFANVTLEMLFAEVLVERVVVVEGLVLAVVATRMLFARVLAEAIAPVHLLLKEEDGFVVKTEVTIVLVVRSIQMILKRLNGWKLPHVVLGLAYLAKETYEA